MEFEILTICIVNRKIYFSTSSNCNLFNLLIDEDSVWKVGRYSVNAVLKFWQ